jgi:hypothetical protein
MFRSHVLAYLLTMREDCQRTDAIATTQDGR